MRGHGRGALLPSLNTQIPAFLAAVLRVLRPGGAFIVREHALDDGCALLPMLDCAHMVRVEKAAGAGLGVAQVAVSCACLCIGMCGCDKAGRVSVGGRDVSTENPQLRRPHRQVFNAVTGVALPEEQAERRCFRPLAHWRAILRAAGFVDSYVYEMQVRLCVAGFWAAA